MVTPEVSGPSPVGSIHAIESIQRVLDDIQQVLPKELEVSVPPNCFALTRDASKIVVGSNKGNLMLYSLITDELLHEADRSNHSIAAVCLSGDDSFLVAADAIGVVSLLEFPSLEVRRVFNLPNKQIPSVELYAPDCFLISDKGNYLALLTLDGNLQEWLRFDTAITAFAFKSGALAVACSNLDLFRYEDSFIQGAPCRLPGTATILELSDDLQTVAAGLEEDNDFNIVFRREEGFTELEGHSRPITGLAFLMNDQFLVSSSKDGSILLWKLHEARSMMNFKIYDSSVSALRFYQHYMYSAQKNNIILVWTMPNLPKNSRYDRHQSEITEIEFFRSDNRVMTADAYGTLIIWDFSRDVVVKELNYGKKLAGFSIGVDCTYCLFCTEEPALYRLSLEDYTTTLISSDTLINCFKFHSNEQTVITGDNKNRLIEWRLPEMKEFSVMKGHFKHITSVVIFNSSNQALSGSKDCTIRLWDLNTHTFMKKLEGHTAPITSVRASKDNKIAYSSSEDGTVKIWDILYGIILHTIRTDKPILNIKLANNDFLMLVDEDSLQYWDLRMLTRIASVSFPEPVSTVNRSDRHGGIGVAAGNVLYILNDPFRKGAFEVVGEDPSFYFRYMKYVHSMIRKRDFSLRHCEEFNDLVFFPRFIGVLHILATANLEERVRWVLTSKENPASIFGSAEGDDPLTIAISNNYTRTTDMLLSHMTRLVGRNRRIMVPLNDSLDKLNLMNLRHLPELYNKLLVKSRSNYLPKRTEKHLPIYHLHDHQLVHQRNFDLEPAQPEQGSNIKFLKAIVKLDLELGTGSSIAFLESLMNCPQQDVLKSKLVNHILRYKWKQVRWYIYSEAIFYVVYLIFLIVHCYSIDSLFPYIALIVMQIVMCIYEVFNMITEKWAYIMSLWNLMDLLRVVLIFTYIGLKDTYPHEGRIVLAFIALFSVFRGISYFRVFKKMRYMINLILEVIRDVKSFMILFVFIMCGTGLALIVLPSSEYDLDIGSEVVQGFRIAIGDYDTGAYTVLEWAVFITSAFLGPIIMLNLLIALMSDTFERVQESAMVADRLELIEMIAEIERMRFRSRTFGTKKYLQVCTTEVIQTETEDVWLGKLNEFKEIVSINQQTMKARFTALEEVILSMDKRLTETQLLIKDVVTSADGRSPKQRRLTMKKTGSNR